MEERAGAPAVDTEIILWDWPVRLVHWGFVLLIPLMWGSAEFGQMGVHRVLGYVLLGLLLFRVYWGMVGTSTARFAAFVRGPAAIARYLRGGAAAIGHNPLGALSVVAMLGLIALQIGLGLFAEDTDGQFAGPLADLVSYETSDAAAQWHETMFYVLLGLIGLHIVAILFYQFGRRDDLVRPMVTGRRRIAPPVAPPAYGSTARALAGIALSAALTLWIAFGASLP